MPDTVYIIGAGASYGEQTQSCLSLAEGIGEFFLL